MKCSVVVTNDDGTESPGIQVLARALERAGHDVCVIAPDHDASGTGTSLGSYSASKPIQYRRDSFARLDGPVFAVSGTPALCSLLAVNEAFDKAPDVVVSGINAGMNTGRSVLHSGTVGAALAAQNFGLKGLAVSLGGGNSWHWDTAAQIALNLLPAILNGPQRSVTNVNVPGLPLSHIKGIRWSHLAKFGSVRAQVTQIGENFVNVENVRTDYTPEWNTDVATTREGMVSLTCLQGVSEVWQSGIGAGKLFDPAQRVSGCMLGDALTPPLLYSKPDSEFQQPHKN